MYTLHSLHCAPHLPSAYKSLATLFYFILFYYILLYFLVYYRIDDLSILYHYPGLVPV